MNPWIKSRTTCLRDPNLLYSDQYLFGGSHMLMIPNEYVKSFLLHLWLYPLCFYISSSILSNRLTHSWLQNSYLYETKNIHSDTRLCLLRKTYIHTWLLDTTLQHSTEANKTTIKTHPDEGQRDTPLRLCFYYWLLSLQKVALHHIVVLHLPFFPHHFFFLSSFKHRLGDSFNHNQSQTTLSSPLFVAFESSLILLSSPYPCRIHVWLV